MTLVNVRLGVSKQSVSVRPMRFCAALRLGENSKAGKDCQGLEKYLVWI